MKDARFKELLNLYLDHSLSEAETAELDRELRADPRRRATLRQYELMQGACAQVFARIESRAPSSQALCRALRQVEEQIENPRAMRDAWGWPTWGITGGLAACVALVVARMSQPVMVASSEAEPARGSATEGARLVAVSTVEQATAVPVQVATVRRATLPNHVAFAALGMTPNSANADSASHWILSQEDILASEPILAVEDVPAWARSTTSATYSSGGFAVRPINAWGRGGATSSGFQVENASYRFER